MANSTVPGKYLCISIVGILLCTFSLKSSAQVGVLNIDELINQSTENFRIDSLHQSWEDSLTHIGYQWVRDFSQRAQLSYESCYRDSAVINRLKAEQEGIKGLEKFIQDTLALSKVLLRQQLEQMLLDQMESIAQFLELKTIFEKRNLAFFPTGNGHYK